MVSETRQGDGETGGTEDPGLPAVTSEFLSAIASIDRERRNPLAMLRDLNLHSHWQRVRARVVPPRLVARHAALIASLFWTAVALAFLLACDLLLFRPALEDGQVYYRSDTVTYYFPIADRLIDVLRDGRMMLWTRDIFGGFPLFADGEAGMLYPPNLVAYLLLSEQDAFIWLRIARYFMAATFTYGYLRTLKLNRFAATVGALAFAFGSFMVTQMHHTNVGNTAIWLPLALAMVELAVCNVGRWRWLYATAAGVSTGIQALGLHIQPLILSGFFLAAYVPFRVLLCPIAESKLKSGREGSSLLWRVVAHRKTRDTRAFLSGMESSTGDVEVPAGDSTPWSRLRGWVGRRMEGLGAGEGRSALILTRVQFETRRGVAAISRLAMRFCLLFGPFLVRALSRIALALTILGIIPVIAFGIAAAQVIPLVELGFSSFRGPGVTYQFATSFSMPVQNLVDLVFPYFFRYTNRLYWSLWSEWETTLYAGIGTLVLASIALLFVRSRMVAFFGVAGTVSTMLAFGNYAPYPLYELLWPLPGFSSLRVPGRFGMLVTFSLAVLAAYGVDWLCRTFRPDTASPKPGRWQRFSRAAAVNGFALYLIGLLTAMAGVLWWLASFRIWVEKEPWAVKRWVENSYLSLRNDRPWLTSDMVISFLNYSLDPTHAKTSISLALMLAVFLLLFCWYAFRRLWRVWATAMVTLVAVDMLLFATDFHPTVHINQLSNPDSAARWLMAHNEDGMTRIYTPKEVRKTEANKLLPFQVADITGYSSLETVRHQEFMAKLNQSDRALLDLYNVRYLVMPKRPTALPSFEYTSYHPNRPLADGPRTNPGSQVTFYVDPPVKVDEVCFISNLRSADQIPQDTEVADIVVVDTHGERTTLKARAGRDTAEWAWDRPDVRPNVKHQKPLVAAQIPTADPDGQKYQANLYLGTLKLDKTRTVSRVEFHYSYPKGAVRLYGMMLWENPSTAHQLLASNRFIPRYEDDEVQILENPSRLPRAYLVPTARVVKRADVLDTMATGDFDPQKTVLLETPNSNSKRPIPEPGYPDPQLVQSWLQGNTEVSPGSAEVVDYRSTEMEIRTKSARNSVLFVADSFEPGWKVLVDGQEEPVYRANYLFRAVLVPSGEHDIRFFFKPDTFDLGVDISMLTLTSLIVLWAGLLTGPYLVRRLRLGVKMMRGRGV